MVDVEVAVESGSGQEGEVASAKRRSSGLDLFSLLPATFTLSTPSGRLSKRPTGGRVPQRGVCFAGYFVSNRPQFC